MEEEYIHGFTIPKRKLTKEEANRDITLERFDEFHGLAGEDFADQTGTCMLNTKVFGGYLLAKYPKLAPEILAQLNNPNGTEPLEFHNIFEEYYGDFDEEGTGLGSNMFYTEYANILNLTKSSKKRVNQVLIQVAEHYKD